MEKIDMPVAKKSLFGPSADVNDAPPNWARTVSITDLIVFVLKLSVALLAVGIPSAIIVAAIISASR